MNTFNPNEHLVQLKSKQGSQDYLPVQWRLVWFRSECPEGTIETEEICCDLSQQVTVETSVWNAEKRRSERVTKTAYGYARYKAVITDGKGGKATAHGSESAADFADFAEKAETKAIGRALAGLGYGTQFAPELSEGNRIADTPTMSNGNKHQEEPTLKQRVDAAYTQMVEKGLIVPVAEKAQNAARFLEVCGKATGANIAALGQLTASRMDQVETYLAADQQIAS